MRIATRISLLLIPFLVCTGTAARAGETTARFDPEVARRITPQEVAQAIARGEKPLIIDTRGRLSGTIIRGALHLPGDRLEAWAKDAPGNRLVVAYCT